jgi:membrane-associated protein
MDFLSQFLDLFLHIDEHLAAIFARFGPLTYAILTAVVFCETGLVVLPLLPGDSLLFAVGAFAARGSLDPVLSFVLLTLAAIVGDSVNYALGKAIGPKVFRENVRFLKREYLLRTEEFYEAHGPKTIVLARFIPIVRTFAPFVAGVGRMHYGRFLTYNILGGILWVALFLWGGYFFGTIPIVAEHFEFVILGIIAVSLLPIAVEFVRGRMGHGKWKMESGK